ncbi:hypothetical protein SeMB42_g02185 [Synchytrium endobioticum]|uniref:Uncharacterized protein n=1 Tax=Synchytrium endobioticum TaxID=286115 RepID=A0A507DIG7_9FUNG|nr:hypothetical protein SeMB42_g02185 [Synchytrium endobioticum]
MQSTLPLCILPDLITIRRDSVQVYIHDPLIPITALRKKRNLDLLVTLSKLEVLLTRLVHTQSPQDEEQIVYTIEQLLRISHQAGYIIKLGLGALIWGSKKQQVVALSSSEAEYMALSILSREVLPDRSAIVDSIIDFPTTD